MAGGNEKVRDGAEGAARGRSGANPPWELPTLCTSLTGSILRAFLSAGSVKGLARDLSPAEGADEGGARRGA